MANSAEQLRTIIGALETALARGERTVQFEDRSVTYNSAAEIRERIAYFSSQLNASTSARPRQSFGVASKGY